MSLFQTIGRGRSRAPLPRRSERYQTTDLRCPLGEIVDLSETGMQVRCPRRPATARGEISRFRLSAGRQGVEVTGRVVWVRRVSLRRFRLGVSFLHLTPAVRAVLAQMARFGFVGGAMGGGKAQPGAVRASLEVEDIYGILGVQPHATPEEVHRAYRALARTLHPDVCKTPEASAQFVLIAKAYSVLRDTERRAKYDRLLAACG